MSLSKEVNILIYLYKLSNPIKCQIEYTIIYNCLVNVVDFL